MISPNRIIPLVVAAALFMEHIDSTVIATSIPAIAADLGTNPVSLKLAFTTYLLSLTVFLPLSGWLADRFGARVIFRIAIVIFTIASVGCGFAPNLTWLVVLRGLQGVGGAMMVPVARIIMIRTVPKSELVNAMAWLTIPALMGPFIGPPLGGFITTFFSWHWIFWINVPFGILAFTVATLYMPNHREERVGPLDFKGFVFAGLGLAATVFGLTVLGRGFLPLATTIALIGFGILCLMTYVRHARVVENPILALPLFAIDTLRISIVGGLYYRIAVGAVPFLLPLMLQIGFGLTAFQSGLITCASAIGALAMKFGAGRMLKQFGYRNLLLVNGVISCGFMGSIGLFTPTWPVLLMSIILLLGGLTRSMQFTALNSIAYAEVTSAQVSKANGLYTVAQQLATALGVAVAATVLDLSLLWRGAAVLANSDFANAFFVVAALGLISILLFAKLPQNAGANLSGQRASE
jgi:EmrB/QacA subfamily drug resistance transporter